MWNRATAPSIPDDLRVYAVGDVHGRLDLLDRLLMAIDHDAGTARDQTVVRLFLGDYIDRGPSSSDVIARLIEIRQNDPHAVFLRGNHEQALLSFLQDPSWYPTWCRFGAEPTLHSYDVTPPLFEDEAAILEVQAALAQALPAGHLAFLNATQLSHTLGDYFFVHAGIRPGTALAEQSPDDLMWIRDEFLSSQLQFEKIVVHGHSPEKKPQMRHNRIGIDTKAYMSGRLTALVLDGAKKRFLTT